MKKTLKKPETKPLPENELKKWFEELIRISTEAEERYKKGELIPALSSLAAIPPLHSTLMENCVTATKDTSSVDGDDHKPGLYL